MATAVSYNVTPEPNLLSTYTSGGYHPQQPGVMYQSRLPTVSGAAPLYGGWASGSGYLAQAGSSSAAGAPKQSMLRHHSTVVNDVAMTTSQVSGVVPTGLYTSYVPASQIQPRDQHSLAGAPKKPVTVYYTDDLYPPYYSKAKKVGATRKRTGCCA